MKSPVMDRTSRARKAAFIGPEQLGVVSCHSVTVFGRKYDSRNIEAVACGYDMDLKNKVKIGTVFLVEETKAHILVRLFLLCDDDVCSQST